MAEMLPSNDDGYNPFNFESFSDDDTADPMQWVESFLARARFKQFNWDKSKDALSCLLMGSAKYWYENLGENELKGETEFKDAFLGKFTNGATIADRHLFSNLKQDPNESVTRFHSRVITKGMRLKVTESELLSVFLRGLPKKIQMFTYARDPQSLHEAYKTATLCESIQKCAANENSDQIPQNEISSLWQESSGNCSHKSEFKRLESHIESLANTLELLTVSVQTIQAKLFSMSMNGGQAHCTYCKHSNHTENSCRYRKRDMRANIDN